MRWVAATNADLLAPDARFRSDLRERLSGYVAKLPPLRNRRFAPQNCTCSPGEVPQRALTKCKRAPLGQLALPFPKMP